MYIFIGAISVVYRDIRVMSNGLIYFLIVLDFDKSHIRSHNIRVHQLHITYQATPVPLIIQVLLSTLSKVAMP